MVKAFIDTTGIDAVTSMISVLYMDYNADPDPETLDEIHQLETLRRKEFLNMADELKVVIK